MGVDNHGVHVTHCCQLHGCKYGDADCPVAKGEVEQEYPCESCDLMGIKSIAIVQAMARGEIKACPHCGHILEQRKQWYPGIVPGEMGNPTRCSECGEPSNALRSTGDSVLCPRCLEKRGS